VNNIQHPKVAEAPEAIDIITKYKLMSKFPAYTFSALDNESYENIQYILLCMNYENISHDMAQCKAQFVQESSV